MNNRLATSFKLLARRTAVLLFALLAFAGFLETAARADSPNPVVAGTVTPGTPSYVDPILLTVTVTSAATGPLNGTLTYSVDGGTNHTAPVTNGSAVIALGNFAPGSHMVSYQYSGTLGQSAFQQTTFAATDLPFRFLGAEEVTVFNHSGFIAAVADSTNNLFLVNYSEGNVYKLDVQRNLTVVPTTPLNSPRGLTIDGDDNLYISDTKNNQVLKLTPAGVQTTIPLIGLSGPRSLAFDRTYANLYVIDYGNTRIEKLNLASGVQSDAVTGIDLIQGLCFDLSGNLYFGTGASFLDGTMYRLDPSGTITSGYFGARSVDNISRDVQGNLYFADDSIGTNKIDTQGHLIHLNDEQAYAVAPDHAGQLYIIGPHVSNLFTPGPSAKFLNALAAGISVGFDMVSQPTKSNFIYQVPYQQTLASVDVTTGGYGNLGGYQPACEELGQCSDEGYFGPSYPGTHNGYVVSTLSNQATLQTNIFGVGLNSNVAFDPGTRTTAPTSLTSAGGLAQAEDHTLYVTDPVAKEVYSLGVDGASAPVALAFTGFTHPTKIGVDGSKNVFVLDGTTRVLELTPKGVQTTVYTAGTNLLTTITAMALDGSGALFLGGTAPEIGAALVVYTAAGDEFILGRMPGNPTVLALDGVGGIFEADASAATLRRYIYNGGPILLANPATIATGFSTPSAITVEPSGTVFLALGTAGTVLQIHPDGSMTNLYSGLGDASAVVEDGRGVLAVVDEANGTLHLDDRRTGAYDFGNEVTGMTSAPSLGSITNDGNQPLGGIGALPGDNIFKQVSENGACVAAVPDAGTSLAPGASCKADYTFTPAKAGPVSETGYEGDSTPAATSRSVNFNGTGATPSPDASFTPATVAFGNVDAGTTSPGQVVTLTNTGTASLTISSVSLTNEPSFAQSTTCGATLAASASCTFTITFHPASGGPASSVLTVTDNASSGTTQTVQISGTGTVVPLTLTPATVDFGSEAPAVTSAPMVFTVTNPGAVAATLTAPSIPVTSPVVFNISSTTCTATLAAKSACTISVTFGATARTPPNTFTNILGLSYNGSSALSSSLSGTILPAPQATLLPNPFNFGSVVVDASASKTFTFSNTGTVAIDPTSTTTNNAAFAVTGTTCGAAVAVGASCTYTVNFTPASTGAKSATLTVSGTASGQAVSYASALSGTGIANALTITPGTITFPSTTVGVTSAAMTATLTNVGSSPVYLTTPTLTDATDFTQSNNCNGMLAPAASCTVTFTFTPKSSGTLSSTFSIADLNNQASPVIVLLSGPATAPVISVTLTPPTLSFQATTSTVAYNQTVTLTNMSVYPLTITSITLSGPNASGFTTYLTLPGSCGTTLAAGASCSISVGFTATTIGMYTATLAVTDNATSTTQTVALTGQVAGVPQASLTPAAAAFGSVSTGANSTQTFTLTNTGTTPLSNTVAVTGANASLFTVTGNTCTASMATGASCSITVTFAPLTTGSFAATLSVSSVNGATTLTEASSLSGTGITPPTLTASPSPIIFPNTTVNTTSGAILVTLTNTGGANLQLQSTIGVVGGTDATAFALASSLCGSTLAPNASCTLTLTFTPTAARAFSGTFSIATNDPKSPTVISLSGTGIPALTFQLILSPVSLTFATTPNVSAPNQTATLLNSGTGNLNLSSILLGGVSASNFSIASNSCGSSLNAGASCAVSLNCSASAPGTYTASLTVADNATNPTQSSSLTCNVTGVPQSSLTPATVDFGTVNVGARSTISTVTLTNAGTAALSIGSISLTGVDAASYAIANNACGASLAAGSSCAIAVTFSPTDTGSTSAALAVVDALGTYISALSGTGATVIPPDFAILATPSAQTTYRGTSVDYTIRLTSLLATSPFLDAATLSATGLPPGATVSFAPATLVPGASSAATTVMTVTVPSVVGSMQWPAKGPQWLQGSLPGTTALAAMAFSWWRRRKGRRLQSLLALTLALSALVSAATLSGCGASNGFGVPTSTSLITVTATSGTIAHSTQVTLTIQ